MTETNGGSLARQDNCFDFLRLFAACAVLFGHSTHYLGISFLWFEPDSRMWFRDGVALFFVMSGMLVYRSAQRCIDEGRPIIQFYTNRLLRIAPAIYFYLIVTTVLLFASGFLAPQDALSPSFLGWFGFTAALVPVYNPDSWRGVAGGVLNGSLWTIPVEVSFYLVVPVFAVVAKKFGFRLMIVGLIGLAVGGVLLAALLDVPRSNWPPAQLLNITFMPYLIFFASGIVLSRYWNSLPQARWVAALCAVIYVTLRIFLPGFNEEGGVAPYVGTLIWVFPFSYLAVWIGYNGPKVLGRITRRIGDLSFGTYIWHMVVVNALLFYGVHESFTFLPNPLIHLLVLSISLSLAFVSWRLVERPALRYKPFSSQVSAAPLSPSDGAPVNGSEPRRTRPWRPNRGDQSAALWRRG